MRTTATGADDGSNRRVPIPPVPSAARVRRRPPLNSLLGAEGDDAAMLSAISIGIGDGVMSCYFHPAQRLEDVVNLRRVIAAWALGKPYGATQEGPA